MLQRTYNNYILLNLERLILASLLAIVYQIFLYRKKPAIAFPHMKLLREIYKTNSKRFRIRNLLISLIIITSGIILSNPNKINEEETILKNGIDIMLALDVSESMLAQDFEPDRLTVAKEVLTKFSEKIETDRL